MRECTVRPIGFLWHPDYLKHETGRHHPEEPARLTAIIRHLEATGMLAGLMRGEPTEPSPAWLALAHTPEYIQAIEQACLGGVKALDPDTVISPDSYRAALLAVSGALLAVDQVMEGTVASAFVALRPPGHHAERERGMGAGLGYTINVPLAAGCGDHEYGEVFEKVLYPAARAFQRNLVLISAGFDAQRVDPQAGMAV